MPVMVSSSAGDPLTDISPILPTEGESLMTTPIRRAFRGTDRADQNGLSGFTYPLDHQDLSRQYQKSKHIVLDENEIPLDDEETFKLFTRGNTTGLFQFESPGMKNTSAPSSQPFRGPGSHERPVSSGACGYILPSSGANTAKNPYTTI